MAYPHLVTDTAYAAYEKLLESEVLGGPIPNHIAVIMDGNRRFAEEVLGADVNEGHIKGKDKLDEFIHWCLRLKVHNFTVYAFSTENFNRPDDEVQFLMKLITDSLMEVADDDEVHSLKVAIRVIGERSLMSPELLKAVDYVESRTADYNDFIFTIAIAYGGRQDITNAVRKIAEKVSSGEMKLEDVNEETISSCMYTGDHPDPDLILRTSGEVRISNFLLWQMAYSELYFTDVYWPSIRYIDLLRAVRTYQQRKRRYGA